MINKKAYLRKAKYVDLLWKDVLKKQIDFIVYIKKKYFGKRPISMIDSACGNGRLVFPLVKNLNTDKVIGYDLSGDMIKEALRRNKYKTKISFKRGDMTFFVSKDKVDLIICMYTSFNYLLTDNEILSSLRCFNKSLKNGGAAIIDASNLFDFALMRTSPTRIIKYHNNKLKIKQVITTDYDSFRNIWKHNEILYVKKGKKVNRIEENHQLRYITRSEMKFFCEKTNFKIEEIFTSYSNKKSKNEHRIIFILRKLK